jgi:hypothetical protein
VGGAAAQQEVDVEDDGEVIVVERPETSSRHVAATPKAKSTPKTKSQSLSSVKRKGSTNKSAKGDKKPAIEKPKIESEEGKKSGVTTKKTKLGSVSLPHPRQQGDNEEENDDGSASDTHQTVQPATSGQVGQSKTMGKSKKRGLDTADKNIPMKSPKRQRLLAAGVKTVRAKHGDESNLRNSPRRRDPTRKESHVDPLDGTQLAAGVPSKQGVDEEEDSTVNPPRLSRSKEDMEENEVENGDESEGEGEAQKSLDEELEDDEQ